MGQAKQRGTREQRIGQALTRVLEEQRIAREKRELEQHAAHLRRQARDAELKAKGLEPRTRIVDGGSRHHGRMLAIALATMGTVLTEPPRRPRWPGDREP